MKLKENKNGTFTFEVEKIVTEDVIYTQETLEARKAKLLDRRAKSLEALSDTEKELEQIKQLQELINVKAA